jgi:hypothetical protein
MKSESADIATEPTVIFIASESRSGSTIIDRMLGSSPGFVSVGELHYLWSRGLVENGLCGCGQPIHQCVFWRKVLARAGIALDSPSTAELLKQRQAAYPDQFLRDCLWKWLTPGYRKARVKHAVLLEKLYEAVCNVACCHTVIDSSKLPAYGNLLRTVKGINLRVIHVIRDSRAVIFSSQREKLFPTSGSLSYMRRMNPYKLATRWLLLNMLFYRLRRKTQSVFIRYEDFAERPIKTCDDIKQSLNLSSLDLQHVESDAVHLISNHSVSGNPNRFDSGKTVIKVDEEWRSKMSVLQFWAVTAITMPLLYLHGYLSKSIELIHKPTDDYLL